MKIKNIGLVFVIALAIFSCGDDNQFTPFDHAAQALIDDDSLVNYLETHYYNATLDSIKKVDSGQTPFSAIVQTETVVENDITYKLYYIVTEEGVGYQPTKIDNVLPTYKGELLDGTIFDQRETITINNPWLNLLGTIKGWQYGMPVFKGGNNLSMPGEPLEFENFGEGFLFIPSGLAYGYDFRSSLQSEPLVFKIELHYSMAADHDEDGVVSNDEDIDNDGDVTNDDTDEDLIPNYVDTDDDGDGVLTEDEVVNGDTDSDGTLDYLDTDDDGDGVLTKDEDTNNNGDPTDDDDDDDGIPNYLDADS
ncbi:MAG: peptidylprolyl isomerase [Flavobacteriaceae bacterium]|nr:peptidylprolyl isomerase [Flavobacteriaceae bacterium]